MLDPFEKWMRDLAQSGLGRVAAVDGARITVANMDAGFWDGLEGVRITSGRAPYPHAGVVGVDLASGGVMLDRPGIFEAGDTVYFANEGAPTIAPGTTLYLAAT